MVKRIIAQLDGLPGVSATRVCPGDPAIQPNWIPRVHVTWDSRVIPLTRDQVVARLMQGEPAVAVGSVGAAIFVNPHTLRPGEDEAVAARIREVLSA